MTTDRDKHKEFWLELLETGNGEKECQRSWNVYCNWRYGSQFDRLIPLEQIKELWRRLGISSYSGEEQKRLNSVVASTVGDHPEWPKDSSKPVESFMDFRGQKTFQNNISFAGRVLIGADFRGVVFEGWADFRGTVFLGLTRFEGARFEGREPMQSASHGVVSFERSTFHNTAYFNRVQFPHVTRFDKATFNSAVYCREAKFSSSSRVGGAVFRRAQFRTLSDFSETDFEVPVGMENVKFHGEAKFTETRFRAESRFNNTKFQNTTSFRGATFGKPPKFFNTDIHEDVNSNGIDWSGAEQSYSHWLHREGDPDSIVEDAEDAIRAWDRLALIMGSQEKLAERHVFHRLKMRAQRQRDGTIPLSAANWLYDVLSGCGWRFGRALAWWICHIAVGAVILADGWPAVPNSLAVSLANSLDFLRLGSRVVICMMRNTLSKGPPVILTGCSL